MEISGPENWKGKFCLTKLEQLSVLTEYALKPIDVWRTIKKRMSQFQIFIMKLDSSPTITNTSNVN